MLLKGPKIIGRELLSVVVNIWGKIVWVWVTVGKSSARIVRGFEISVIEQELNHHCPGSVPLRTI